MILSSECVIVTHNPRNMPNDSNELDLLEKKIYINDKVDAFACMTSNKNGVQNGQESGSSMVNNTLLLHTRY